MNELYTYILAKVGMDNAILSEALEHFNVKLLKKNAYLIRPGQYMDNYYFVKSGGLRVYLKNNDKEFTAWLSFENNFLVDISSINSKKPSKYYIQAIEDTELLAISSKSMSQLYGKYNEWQEFGRKLWEQAFLEVVDEMINHQTLSAEERYIKFMAKSDIFHRIPLKQLCSFLGVTPNSLSRIRKNIR